MPRQNFTVQIEGSVGKYNYNGTPISGYPKTVPSRYSTESSSGTSRRKPQGWVSPTSYTFRKERITYQRGTHRQEFYIPGYPYGGSADGVVGTSSGQGLFNGLNNFNDCVTEAALWQLGPNMLNRALIKARVKLKDQDVNLGVAFGERNATARLLGDTAIRLFRSIRHLKSGRIRRAMDELGITSRNRQPRGNNVPQKWLELQYGWKPLLSDVYGAADALNKRPPGDWRVTVKGTVSEVYAKSVRRGLTTATPSDCAAGGFVGAFVRIDALPQNAATIALSSLGVTNPLEIGWELVPFSFVVDWFLPIGNYLSSLDALLGYSTTGTWCSQSFFVKMKWTDTGVPMHSSGSWRYYNDWTGQKELVRLSRTVSQGVPLPAFPSFKDPRSLGHMANGLALLAGLFGRTSK